MEIPQTAVSPPPETFETPRLRLRRPTLADAPDIFEYASDQEVTRYLTFTTHRTPDTVEEFLRGLLLAMEQGGRYGWGLTQTGSDRLIGMIEIRIQPPRAEVGYVLAKKFWGQGYMVEAVRVIVEWAFRQSPIHRVWAFCDADNRGSARVLEKAGMTREGTLRKWAMSPNLSDAPRDCHCYSIVKPSTSPDTAAPGSVSMRHK